MNNRVFDIANQVKGSRSSSDTFTFNDNELKAFAELLIKESLLEVWDEVQYISSFEEADSVTDRVKKHFGIN